MRTPLRVECDMSPCGDQRGAQSMEGSLQERGMGERSSLADFVLPKEIFLHICFRIMVR